MERRRPFCNRGEDNALVSLEGLQAEQVRPVLPNCKEGEVEVLAQPRRDAPTVKKPAPNRRPCERFGVSEPVRYVQECSRLAKHGFVCNVVVVSEAC